MSSPELPIPPEETPLEVLFQQAKEAILGDKNKRRELGENALEALVAWQETAEREANIQNTSIANTEVTISRAQLFMEANRPDLALIDLEDALLAAENDTSFPGARLEELRSIRKKLVAE